MVVVLLFVVFMGVLMRFAKFFFFSSIEKKKFFGAFGKFFISFLGFVVFVKFFLFCVDVVLDVLKSIDLSEVVIEGYFDEMGY